MPGLTATDSIDLVAQDANGTVLLVIVEADPWGTHPDQDDRLIAKMNTYGLYATSQLHEDYPQTRGAPVMVRIDCVGPPPADILNKLSSARTHFAQHGIGVEVNIDPSLRNL